MTDQLAIGAVDKAAPPEPKLTPRQQLAYQYLRDHDGVTADEVGAWLHTHRDKKPHSVDERCDYCARDGLSVLRSKALTPLVTYRRDACGHLYLPRDPADRKQADGRYDPATGVIPF